MRRIPITRTDREGTVTAGTALYNQLTGLPSDLRDIDGAPMVVPSGSLVRYDIADDHVGFSRGAEQPSED